MKAIVKKAATKKARPFPKLMISADDTIVFFTKSGYGFVVGESTISKWDTSPAGWAMSCFTDFEGTVTLSND